MTSSTDDLGSVTVSRVGTDPREASTEKNWRLQAGFEVADNGGALERLVGSMRDPVALKKIEGSVPHDVVITHDGNRLFAYASDEADLQEARHAIESMIGHEGFAATAIRLSHWDNTLDDWRQTDPPLATVREKQAEEAAERNAESVETRTLVASAGNLIRAEFEQSLLEWASELGVQCKVIEHRHLLNSQVGFTVTGSKRKLDEFAEGLKAEERATIRTETAVMLSPL